MEERQWIKAIQSGDKKCFSDIAEKYYDDIFRFCAFQTGSREDAYDLAQETFLRFILYAESYRSKNLKGYLLTIAMNLCRNYHRIKNRETAMQVQLPETGGESEEPLNFAERRGRQSGKEGMTCGGKNNVTPEELAVDGEAAGLLLAALKELPDRQREAILLHYFYDMKYREISRLTGANISTVKSRIRQGTEKLGKLLRREDFFDA